MYIYIYIYYTHIRRESRSEGEGLELKIVNNSIALYCQVPPPFLHRVRLAFIADAVPHSSFLVKRVALSQMCGTAHSIF